MKTGAVFFLFFFFVITMQLSIGLGQSISEKDSTRTCKKNHEEADIEQRLLEKMRLAFVSIVYSVNSEMSAKIDELTRQVDTLSNKLAFSCPGRDWKVFDNACYFFSSNEATWENAKQRCEDFGGNSHLASVTSENINNFLVANTNSPPQHFWIGGNDRDQEGNWIWDFNKERIREYSAWSENEPNNNKNDEDCLEFRKSNVEIRYWNDAKCEVFKKFICQQYR